MKNLVFAVIALCCSTLFVSAQKYHSGYQDGAIWLKLKASEDILIKKKEKPTVDDIRILKPLKEKYKLKNLEKPFQKIRKSSPLQNTYLLTFDQIQEADKLIKELEKSEVLEYAEKVPLYTTFSDPPNDPSLTTQWNLTKINAKGAWDRFSTGSNTVIAIVDDAIQITHPDLAPNIWVNPGEIAGNGIDDDSNGYVDDVNGWDFANNDNNPNPPSTSYNHGTHVAGIASAASDNATGVASIGFSAKLMCLRTANAPTSIAYGFYGIIYAADNGADVINLSWGGTSSSITVQRIINYALSKGCIIVAAAGNSNLEGALYPAAYPGVISVAATDENDYKASFSHYGSGITISAPGSNILSTTVNGGYGTSSGTSMASPMVAGLVALIHSYNPNIKDADLVNYLKTTATNIDALNPTYAGKLGAGRINAEAAMQAVALTLTFPPTADFSASFSSISTGGSISFTDLSSYAPTSWSWSFSGGTPAVSTAQNPANIVWNTPGTYPVTLTVENEYGTHSKTVNITVTTYSNCELLNYAASENWSAVSYSLGSGGWLNGVNARNDKQKAMYFDASFTPAAYLTNVWIGFDDASTSNTNKIVTIRVYDGTSGLPGTLLGSTNLTMSQIIQDIANNRYTIADFLTPVSIPTSRKFFVSVDFSDLCWNCTSPDNLNIVSSLDGETMSSDIWEQISNGTWQRYYTESSWPANISLYIHPSLTNKPAVATFTSSATTICAGSSVSFNAAGSTYQDGLVWSFANGSPSSVTNNTTPSVVFNTAGTHQVTLTIKGGGCSDIRSSTASITVNENETPTVSLSSNTTMPGVPVTFTANATNGGTNPVFDFKRNGTTVQSGSTNTWSIDALEGGDEISCTLTANKSCVTSSSATSNTITMDAISMMVLPVELIYFKGNSVNGKNLLQWATASEANTDKFVIERSTDGIRFYEIGTIKAKGESNATVTYQFEDSRFTPTYYRLRIIDSDGSFKYTQVIYLKDDNGTNLLVWPNPVVVGQRVQLVRTGSKTRRVSMQLIDVFGKALYKRTLTVKNGRMEIGVPAENLNAGIYFITITDETGGEVQQEKLIVVK
jgi:subtilisin family serine protease